MHHPPSPKPRTLLPPLLACLPTSFISPQPPPALLPLLSPILRQRVNLLSSPGSTGRHGWLPLLSWDQTRASKLPAAIERMDLEPHPVSGEIELEDVHAIKYRRLDEETLQARLPLEEAELLPIFVWCESDEHGGGGPGWRLAELRSLEDIDDGTEWFHSMGEASDAANTTSFSVPQPIAGPNGTSSYQAPARQNQQPEADEEDDGDYWAAYDHTPSRAPTQKRSPAPPSSSTFQQAETGRLRSQSEIEYFSRYGAEVQPAMDGHDPDEENPEITGESTLNGNELQSRQLGLRILPLETSNLSSSSYHSSLPPPHSMSKGPHDSAIASASARNPSETLHSELSAPWPVSLTYSHSSIERLEERAVEMNGEKESSTRAEMGIKQHISTDIKSLYRLARSVGLERSEFKRIVRTELELLGMLD